MIKNMFVYLKKQNYFKLISNNRSLFQEFFFGNKNTEDWQDYRKFLHPRTEIQYNQY